MHRAQVNLNCEQVNLKVNVPTSPLISIQMY